MRYVKLWRALAPAALAVGATLAAPAGAAAQSTTGTVLGTVKDSSGAPVPGATLTATNLGTNYSRSVETDTRGQYSIPQLPLGEYRVEASVPGFKTFVQSPVMLEVNRNARVDPVLSVGSVEDTVVVTADAPLVETTTATLGRTITEDEVINLPLVDRDVYSLLELTAGVDRASGGVTFGLPTQETVVNGSPVAGAGAVNYYLDGGSNLNGLRNTGNLTPNPDAVQEFRVMTNSFSAEFGRFGGGAVDVITKSGTNEFHGSAFEFFRNDSLAAKPWTIEGTPPENPLSRHQFGATLGGPLAKDQTFFFFSYSGLRQETTFFNSGTRVPSLAERGGIFSQTVTDPATGAPFPNNTIPADRWDPVAASILQDSVPEGNFVDDNGIDRFRFERPRPLDEDQFQIKLNHTMSSTQQLTASYFFVRRENVNPVLGNLPWSSQAISSRQHNFNLAHDWTLSGSTINSLRVTYIRNFGSRQNDPGTSLGDLGSAFSIQGPSALPSLNVSPYFNLGHAIFGPTAGSNLYSVRDVLSLSRGRHSLRIGGEFSLEKMIHDTTLNNYGVFRFDGFATGNAFADFLLGIPRTMNQDAPILKYDNSWYFSLFAQDDFRVNERLTLNLGLRYDLQLPLTDPFDQKVTFVEGVQSSIAPGAPVGLLFPGDPGPGGTIPRGIVPADKNNISPRLGIAWDPAGDGRTALRAGFGVFYGSMSGNEWNQSADNQPFTTRQQFNNPGTLSNPYANLPGGVSPYPFIYDPANPQFLFPANVYGPSLDFVLPYTYQMNLSVQRELLPNFSVNAAYVGAIGRKYPLSPDINYPQPTPGATSQNLDERRPIQPGTLARVNLIQPIGGSDYHGFQLSAEKRGRRFTAKGFYTFGKALHDAELGFDTVRGSGATVEAQNATNLAAERGRARGDRTHRFVASLIWKLDYFDDSNAIVKGLFNGWTLSAIARASSGEYFTVEAGRDANLDGRGTDRANLDGDWELSGSRSDEERIDEWFDTSAFSEPANGTDGTAGRNIVRGPGFKEVDLGLYRDFRLGGAILQLRIEATNAFNIVNWNNPNGNIRNSNFGRITTARGMREVQLGAKISF
jgi:hypothetical protein